MNAATRDRIDGLLAAAHFLLQKISEEFEVDTPTEFDLQIAQARITINCARQVLRQTPSE